MSAPDVAAGDATGTAASEAARDAARDTWSTARREPFAAAIRTAREIVTHEGCALGVAAKSDDEGAFEHAAEALARRIAQALLEWSETAADHGGGHGHGGGRGHVDLADVPSSASLGLPAMTPDCARAK